MKTFTFYTLFMMVCSIGVYAQQGSWYIGGVAGYASNTSESPSGAKTTASEWAFGPEIGTFVKDDIQLGFFLGVSGSKVKNSTADLYESSTFSPTLYGRKFFKVTDNLSTFTGLYLNIASGNSTQYSTGTPVKTDASGFGVRLGVGVAYALSPRFTAVGQYGLFGYSTQKNKVGGSDAGTDSSFDFGVNTIGSSLLSQGNGSRSVFNIGLYYTFKQGQ